MLPLILLLTLASIRIPGPGGAGSITPPTSNPVITGQTLGTLRNNFAGCIGFSFTPSSNLTVTSLGRWIVSGNTTTIFLALTDTGGSSIGHCSLNTSLQTPAAYGYCTPASAISLTSGTTYFMFASEANGGDQWYDSNTTVTVTADITLNNPEYATTPSGNNCLSPGSTGSAPNSYGPVNFKYY